MFKTFCYFLDQNPRLKKLYKNVAVIFGGNIFSSILNFIVLSLSAKLLSLSDFGIFSLVIAYVSLMDRFASFQTWKALIHYAAHHVENSSLGRLFSFGFYLDALGGFLAGVLALCIGKILPSWIGINPDDYILIGISSLVLFFNWISTPTAITRKYNRFKLQVKFQNITALINLLGVFILFLLKKIEVFDFVCVWTISQVVGKLYFTFAAYKELKLKNIYISKFKFQEVFDENKGLLRFVVTTNFDGIVKVIKDADIFLVNHVLGPSAVGLYKISREITKVATKLTGPFYQAIYPDLAELASKKAYLDFRRLMRQSAFSLGGIVAIGWIIFFFFGKMLIAIFMGEQYLESFQVALWTLAAMVVWAISQPLSPAMLAIGRPGDNLFINFIATIIYCVLMYVLTIKLGLIGAGVALFVFHVIWSAMIYFSLNYRLKAEC